MKKERNRKKSRTKAFKIIYVFLSVLLKKEKKSYIMDRQIEERQEEKKIRY